MAAKQNYAPAQNNLATMYWNGWGVTENREAALKYLELASREGYAPAQYNVALSYATRDLETNYPDMAVKWLEAADQSDYAPASFKLGVDAAKGLGVGEGLRESGTIVCEGGESGGSLVTV